MRPPWPERPPRGLEGVGRRPEQAGNPPAEAKLRGIAATRSFQDAWATASPVAAAPALGRRNRRPLATAAEVAGVASMLALTGLAVAALSPAVLSRAPALRLRVVAASNAPADQAVKRRVRNAVVAEVAPVVRGARTLDGARRLLQADLPQVLAAARSAAGPSVPVRAGLGPDRFPARSFGLLRFPAGRYETLLVTLGAGRGHNWWTVLFPPFAFVRFGPHLAVVGPDRGGSAGGRVKIVADGSRGAAPVEVRFALWDLWKQLVRSVG